MKEIPLTHGKVALVDDKDYERVNKFKWHAQRQGPRWYARGVLKKGKSATYLHHFVFGKKVMLDHKDKDSLNNQRNNLRPCNKSQNGVNRFLNKNNTSGHIGVSRDSNRDVWIAQITVRRRHIHLGRFANLEDAISVRNAAAKKYFGEFPTLNAMPTPKTQFQTIRPIIHDDHDPYRDFPKGQWIGHYNTDGSERDIFKKAMDLLKPKVIIEAGTFLGGSALFMARHVKATDSDTAIICVDTWLGGTDHLLRAREKLRPHFGRPSLYYYFMNNVLEAQMEDVIIPFPIDSLAGARFLKERGVKCQMVYVDSSHEQGDVRRDYEAYWELLDSGGGMLVDDLTGWFPGVVHDWTEFIRDHNLTPIMSEGEKSLVVKP